MRITAKKKIEDCFDGSSIYIYWFDTRLTAVFIRSLDFLGELEYFPDFPRPFFRLHSKEGLQIKGVEGEDNCRVIFPGKGREVIERKLNEHFQADSHLLSC